jgi:hypothetical protein
MANLAHLLRRRVDGIFAAEHDAGEMVYDLFGAACQLGLEGIVSRRCDVRTAQANAARSLRDTPLKAITVHTDRSQQQLD